MFPKQNFSVKITDARLLDAKRGTLKRSASTHNYSLQKTASSILIKLAEPLAFKDYLLGFVEGKVDLLNEKAGEYKVEVGLKKMIKGIYLFFTIILLFRVFSIIMGTPIEIGFDIMGFIVLPTVFYFQYHQFSKAAKLLAERLQEDKSIFAGV